MRRVERDEWVIRKRRGKRKCPDFQHRQATGE